MKYRCHADAEVALDHMRKDMDGTIRVLNEVRRQRDALRSALDRMVQETDEAHGHSQEAIDDAESALKATVNG